MISVYTVSRAIPTTCILLLAGCFGGFDPPATAKQANATGKPGDKRGAASGRDAKEKKPQQTYAQAWQVICQAEQRSGADPRANRVERGAQVAAWIVEHLKNKKARYWFIGFGKVKKSRRARFVAEARRAGIEDCALTSLLFDGAQPASQPTSQPTP